MRTSKFLVWCIFGLLFSIASSSSPSRHKIDFASGEKSVDFLATGKPSSLKIKGHGDDLGGLFSWIDQEVSGEATFRLDSLDTGIGLRNEHMKKKYLETEKFPEARLRIQALHAPTFENLQSQRELPFEGTLLLHGVEKPVKGVAKLEKSDGRLKLDTEFNLKISDFGISSPGFAGITMADEVKIEVRFAGSVNSL